MSEEQNDHGAAIMEPVPQWMAVHYHEAMETPVDSFAEAFTKILDGQVEGFRRIAGWLRAADERGIDLTSVKIEWMTDLRRIAYGQMLPEVLQKYGRNAFLRRKISSLPLPEQQRFVDDKPIEVVEFDDHGLPTKRLVRPTAMLDAQINQVVASDGRIRSEDEQVQYLKYKREQQREAATRAKKTGPYIFEGRGRERGVRFTDTQKRWTRRELLDVLGSLE